MPDVTNVQFRRRPRTDEAIMDAAETLFGRHGPDGVSLRQIGAAAGCANNFAVQYHFKTRQDLIQRVFARRLPSLEIRRAKALDALIADGREADTRYLLEALLRPIADERDEAGNRSWAAFLLGLRVFSDLPELWMEYSPAVPVTFRINDLLRQSVAGLPEPVFLDRLLAATTLFLTVVVDLDRRPGSRANGEAEALDLALDFASAGLSGPYTALAGARRA